MTETADAVDVRARRHCLLAAINAHDIEAVRSFISPSFSAKTEFGVGVADYQQFMRHGTEVFRDEPDYRETLTIESVDVYGDLATLVTQRDHSLTWLRQFAQQSLRRQVETWSRTHGRWLLLEERLSWASPPRSP